MNNIMTVSDQLASSGSRVDRLYPYQRKAAKSTIAQMASPSGLIVERSLMTALQEQGFDLDPSRDNKSVYDPCALFLNLERYGESPATGKVNKKHMEQAIALGFKAFGHDGQRKKLKPLALTAALENVIKGEKASGAPEFLRKADAFHRDLDRANRIAENCRTGQGSKSAPPCVAYHRIQHGPEGPKTRLVWGYPLSMTLLEGSYARPLIDHFLTVKTPMAFGLQKFQLAARLVRVRNGGVNYSIDFSKFDATIPNDLISVGFRILSTWFDDLDDAVWDKIGNYFIHTPIVMPDGYVWLKHRGVPSGSYFTQMIDSIVNYIVIQYIMLESCGRAVTNTLVLGDDSIFSCTTWVSLDLLNEKARTLGMTISVAKSGRFRDGELVNFLGHTWKQGLVDRPVEDTAKRLAFPETWSKESDAVKRHNSRLMGYLSDSVSAWEVVRPMFQYSGNCVFGYVSKPMSNIPVTGWWEYQEVQGNKIPEASRFGYLGLLL